MTTWCGGSSAFVRGRSIGRVVCSKASASCTRLEVFEFANVQPVREEGEQPQQIPTRITVTEGKHRRLNFGVGYGSEERARVQADWRHVNFFGGARTAGVLGRYSSLDRGVKVNLTEPYFFSPRYTFSSRRSVLAQRRAGVQTGQRRRPHHSDSPVHARGSRRVPVASEQYPVVHIRE